VLRRRCIDGRTADPPTDPRGRGCVCTAAGKYDSDPEESEDRSGRNKLADDDDKDSDGVVGRELGPAMCKASSSSVVL
jgi:hypothetical protein